MYNSHRRQHIRATDRLDICLTMNNRVNMRFFERVSKGKQLLFFNSEGLCSCFFCEGGCNFCSPMNIHRSSYSSLLFYVRHGLYLEPGTVITSAHIKTAYDIESELRKVTMRLTPDSLLNLSLKVALDQQLDTTALPKCVLDYCEYYESYQLDFGTDSLDLNIFPLMLRTHLGYATDFYID